MVESEIIPFTGGFITLRHPWEDTEVKLFPNDQAARIYCHMERITQFELCEYTFDNSVFGKWGNSVR